VTGLGAFFSKIAYAAATADPAALEAHLKAAG